MTATAAGTGAADGVAIRNRGFNAGVFVEAGRRYDYSFWARRDGAGDLPVRVAVEDAAGADRPRRRGRHDHQRRVEEVRGGS